MFRVRAVLTVAFLVLLVKPAAAGWGDTAEEKELKASFRRWTNCETQYRGRAPFNYNVTFLAPKLVEQWMEYETDETSRSRIETLYNTIVEEGYSVYVFEIHVPNAATVTLTPFLDNVSLSIAEREPKAHRPTCHMESLDRTLHGPQVFYGVAAFDVDNDAFSFQNVVVDAAWSKGAIFGDDADKGVHHLQFAFLPNGVPKEAQCGSGRGDIELADVLGILQIGLTVVRLLLLKG